MIIDFHSHVFPDKIAKRTIDALSKLGDVSPFSDGTLSTLKQKIAEAGVDVAISLPVLTTPEQFESVLAFAMQVNAEFDEKQGGILSFAGIHPLCDDLEGKVRKIKERGFLGIKIHPDYQKTFFDDERYERILLEAKKQDLVVVTHAGVDIGFPDQPVCCTPDMVAKVLQRVGEMKLVLAHLGGCFMLDEVYEKLAGKDVYFDTSFILKETGKDKFTALIKKHGADKMLFGTDTPWHNASMELRLINSLDISDDDKQKIFYKNAKKLLQI